MLAVAALVVVIVVLTSARGGDILTRWAQENGFTILERQQVVFYKGPFTLTSTRSQIVYRVTVQDNTGSTRSGWVRCGSWWGGLISNAAEVRWDK